MELDATEFLSDLLVDQLSLLYAEAVKDKLHAVSRQMCFGCQKGQLSQTRHSCITLTSEQMLQRYFTHILLHIDE